jgi:hypothetical protein
VALPALTLWWFGYGGTPPDEASSSGATKPSTAVQICANNARPGQVELKWNQIRRTLVLTTAPTLNNWLRKVATSAVATSGPSAPRFAEQHHQGVGHQVLLHREGVGQEHMRTEPADR